MIIRSARLSDLPALLELSASLPGGMTSMPFNRDTWQKKLELVERSFQLSAQPGCIEEAIFFFVLEDQHTGAIAGTCGMHTGVGLTRPFYNYKLSRHMSKSEQLGITVNSNTLNLCNDFTGETELVSLFLKSDFRSGKVGQFLSRVRFMFIRDFSDYFASVVFAEIRGWLDVDGNSPFWDNLGNKFFDMPFLKADFISAVNGYQFISDLMPRFPVYLELLPPEAVSVIGQPNRDSVAAKKLLEKEGFRYQGLVDIFDAGPVVQCEKERIVSVNQTHDYTISTTFADDSENPGDIECIISNRNFGAFRAVIGRMRMLENHQVAVSEGVLDAIQVDVGASISVLPLR
ncbi:arginine N-succinyltransferase [Halioxenophilus sp. WMMB6]|uniref:arginine N-succinyltransferase n=1 Tax=Halioxenophilus sp. WMMB6 TaxID=3073815 RepID=UPI00295E6DDF|nr:arginine N-succinyltransferase [Halioxenophilus sp. WMMB6]